MSARWKVSALGALVLPLALAGILSTHAEAEQAAQPIAPVAGWLDAGEFHSCAVLPTAALRCWGYGADGALGYGNRSTIGDDEAPAAAGPVDVGAGRTVRAVAAGAVHTCAALDDGAVRCWGFGADGRLGYGNLTDIGDDEVPSSIAPVNIGAGRTAKAITAGLAHTCVILDTDAVRCWGFGGQGRLGYGTQETVGDNEPPGGLDPVVLGRPARAISAGEAHTCAILDNASVRCWGLGTAGQLGYGSIGNVGDDEAPSLIGPVDLGAGRTAVALSSGDFHTCAVLDDATVRCWGFGGQGRLGYANANSIGDDETPGSAGPIDIGSGRTARAISGGDRHTCALLDNGSVRCWGNASNGQLGYGNRTNIGDDETPGSVGPVDLGPGRTAVAITAAGDHTCVRLDDGSTRCWGRGLNGELGTCDTNALGDDESPASRAPIDLGVPGVPGTGCTGSITPPPPPPVTPPPAAVPVAPPPAAVPVAPPPATSTDAMQEALRLQDARMKDLRACRSSATSKARTARSRALRRYRRQPGARSNALRLIARTAAQRRARCIKTFGRTPGRVTTLSARVTGRATVILRLDAVGSDGSRAPAARGYLVKQSTRPIRTTGQFERAQGLCKGICRFDDIVEPGADLTLRVTGLRRRTTYYYAIAARDNVSGRRGVRSRTITVRTR